MSSWWRTDNRLFSLPTPTSFHGHQWIWWLHLWERIAWVDRKDWHRGAEDGVCVGGGGSKHESLWKELRAREKRRNKTEKQNKTKPRHTNLEVRNWKKNSKSVVWCVNFRRILGKKCIGLQGTCGDKVPELPCVLFCYVTLKNISGYIRIKISTKSSLPCPFRQKVTLLPRSW